MRDFRLVGLEWDMLALARDLYCHKALGISATSLMYLVAQHTNPNHSSNHGRAHAHAHAHAHGGGPPDLPQLPALGAGLQALPRQV